MSVRAAIYTRISQDKEDRGMANCARQEADCIRYCEEQGWTVFAVFTDNGISAHSGKLRPQFEALRKAVKARQIDIVIVTRQDRLARQPTQLHQFLDDLIANNVKFRSLADPGADLETPDGQMYLTMSAGMARRESETIRVRVKRGLQERADKGLPHMGGKARPFGWAEDRMTLHPEEAGVIRTLVARLLAGESVYALVKELNDQGGRTPLGNQWAVRVMMKLLTNPRLVGYRTHNGKLIPSQIEPILTENEFEDLQRRLGRPSVISGDKVLSAPSDGKWNTREVRLLGGVAYCACHDTAMRYTGGRWSCFFGSCAIDGPWLESHVTKDALFALAGRTLMDDDRPSAEAVQAELAAVRKDVETLAVDFYINKRMPESAYDAANQAGMARMEELESELLTLDQMQLSRGPDGRLSYEDWWETATELERRDALKSILRRVIVLPDRPVRQALKAAGGAPGRVSEEVRRLRTKIVYQGDPEERDGGAFYLTPVPNVTLSTGEVS